MMQSVFSEGVFWEGGDDDQINARLSAVEVEIEKVCKAVIQGRGTLHGRLERLAAPVWRG